MTLEADRRQPNGVLEQLLEVLAKEVEALAKSIEQLYDDSFVETADARATQNARRGLIAVALLPVAGVLCVGRRRGRP